MSGGKKEREDNPREKGLLLSKEEEQREKKDTQNDKMVHCDQLKFETRSCS